MAFTADTAAPAAQPQSARAPVACGEPDLGGRGCPGVPGSCPRAVVGYRGVRRVRNCNLPSDPFGAGSRLADLCTGAPQTDRPPPLRGVLKGPLSARRHQTTEEVTAKLALRVPPASGAAAPRVGGRRIFPREGGAAESWRPLGKRAVADSWAPSPEEPEFGRIRRARRREPPISATCKVDRLQKEADRRALLSIRCGDEPAPAAPPPLNDGGVAAAGCGTLPPDVAAGGPGSMYEPMCIALRQGKEELSALHRAACARKDNVGGLLGGGGGVQVGPTAPVPRLQLPQRAIEQARPRPPYQQQPHQGVGEYVTPQRISSQFALPKDGDGTGPRSEYRRRVLRRMDVDSRPAWH
eukprot:TRINITY_DN28759_c0_g1_i1.p1 TRINITY_DN28759_c0_g1~~TRINITY_DN28759_c0_g1_i1.p1  ORF type:complete len:374 (+),score=92.72 TRINITY_DN28759_c0_g1_i1:64-1122(+)